VRGDAELRFSEDVASKPSLSRSMSVHHAMAELISGHSALANLIEIWGSLESADEK
jgi:hypothetical protein